MKTKKYMVEFTKKQFMDLLKVVFLGNWMANAWRTEIMKKGYERIEDFVFSKAPQFGLERFMDHEASDGNRYYPTRYFEEETDVHILQEEYDEEMFWDELAERLGERDFLEKYTQKEIEDMSREEQFTKIYACIDAVREELEIHGIERLQVIKK